MFERYTEKARRVIFFARYEASQFGSPYIETEHLLLGLLREDKALANRFLRSAAQIDSIRKQIEGHTTIREKVSTSVDLPLSHECKRVLAYGAEEAERLNHKHIGTEHLLLGLLREEKCFAAEILHERGLRLSAVREEISRSASEKMTASRPKESSLLTEFSRDLTQSALDGTLDPLIGRDYELERVVQILCRRTKNNPVLIGEPGVGKTAIVEGLAQRIAEGDVPSFLADKRILALDLSLIVAGTKYRGQFEERLKTIMKELMENQNAIIFIDELHTLVGAGSAEGSLDAANILKPALSRGEIQCIGATTPGEYRKSIEKDRSLERRFQAVKVPPPNEADAVQILRGIKERYEKFHAVAYTDDAIETAVFTSSRFIPDRFLPDKAIDLIDEAGARVKLRQTTLPTEVNEIQKRIKFIVHRMENAIANHEFEKARFYSDEERKERENLRLLRERYNLDDTSTGVVTKDDIEDVVARWTGVPMTSIKEEEVAKLLRIEEELHKRIVSQERAISALSRAIRRSRAGLKSPKRPGGLVPVPGADGRRQDGSRPRAGRVPVRQREGAGPLRHVRVHGEALGLEAHRIASRIRGLRRGRPVDRAREAPALFRDPARRNREGAPGRLQHPAAGVRRRPVDRRHRQHGRLQEHHHHHDLQPGRPLPGEEGRHGLLGPGGRGHSAEGRRHGDGRGEARLQPRVPEPPGRGDPVPVAHRRRPDQDHRPAGGPDQSEPGRQADQDAPDGRGRRSTSSRRPATTAASARARCAAPCRSTSRIRSRRR